MPDKVQHGPTWKEVQKVLIEQEREELWSEGDEISEGIRKRGYSTKKDKERQKYIEKRLDYLADLLDEVDPDYFLFHSVFGPVKPSILPPLPKDENPPWSPKEFERRRLRGRILGPPVPDPLKALKKMRSALSAVMGVHSYYGASSPD